MIHFYKTVAFSPPLSERKKFRENILSGALSPETFETKFIPYINEQPQQSGKTAVHRAFSKLFQDCQDGNDQKIATSSKIVALLLKHGGDITLPDNAGVTPLGLLFAGTKGSPVNTRVFEELYKISILPELQTHPVAHLKLLMVPALLDIQLVQEIPPAQVLFMCRAIDAFVQNPRFPGEIRSAPHCGMGLFATQAIPPGRVVAVFYGGLIKSDLTESDIWRQCKEKGLRYECIDTHAAYRTDVRKQGYLLIPTEKDIQSQNPACSWYINEGFLNVFYCSFGPFSLAISIKNIPKDSEMTCFYGRPNESIQILKGKKGYRFSKQTICNFMFYQLQLSLLTTKDKLDDMLRRKLDGFCQGLIDENLSRQIYYVQAFAAMDGWQLGGDSADLIGGISGYAKTHNLHLLKSYMSSASMNALEVGAFFPENLPPKMLEMLTAAAKAIYEKLYPND